MAKTENWNEKAGDSDVVRLFIPACDFLAAGEQTGGGERSESKKIVQRITFIMKRNFLQALTIVGIGITLCASLAYSSRTGAADNTPTPTSSSSPVVMIFTQSDGNTLPKVELEFTIREDGTTTLTTASVYHDTRIERWQQAGLVSSEQLAQIKALVPTLNRMDSQFAPDFQSDFSFAFPDPASGTATKTKTVEIRSVFEHTNPKDQPAIKNAIQILTDIRKPFEPLMIFEWEIAYATAAFPVQITLGNDGSAWYLTRTQKPVRFALSIEDQAAITKLIPTLENYQPAAGGCNDCNIYSMTFKQRNGSFTTVSIDQVAFEHTTESLQLLINALKEIVSNETDKLGITLIPGVKTTQTPLPTPTQYITVPPINPTPTGTSTPTPPVADCCTAFITKGDFMRRISILKSDDVMVAAARRLQLHANEAPAECIVLIWHGPVSYDITIFDGYWIEVENDPPQERVDELVAAATKTVETNCGVGHVHVMRLP